MKRRLGDYRSKIRDHVERRVRDGRIGRPNDGRDDLELSDAEIQADLDLALLQMRGETLVRIDEALARLDAGVYGSCVECAGEISKRRLRAQPFAVCCLACEERRERRGPAGQFAERRGALSLFPDAINL